MLSKLFLLKLHTTLAWLSQRIVCIFIDVCTIVKLTCEIYKDLLYNRAHLIVSLSTLLFNICRKIRYYPLAILNSFNPNNILRQYNQRRSINKNFKRRLIIDISNPKIHVCHS